ADEGRASVRLEAGADYMLPGNAPAAARLHEADRLCKFLQLVPGNPSTDGFEGLPTGMHIRGKWPEITIDHDAVIFWERDVAGSNPVAPTSSCPAGRPRAQSRRSPRPLSYSRFPPLP